MIAAFEQPVPLEKAGPLVPGGAARSTLFRWATEGFRGVRLRTIKTRRKRLVLPSEIRRFLERTTIDDGGSEPGDLAGERSPYAPPAAATDERRMAARQASRRLAVKLGLPGQRKKNRAKQ
jgi:hypothetical protein